MNSLRYAVKPGFYAGQRNIARFQTWLRPRSTRRFALFSLHGIAPVSAAISVTVDFLDGKIAPWFQRVFPNPQGM